MVVDVGIKCPTFESLVSDREEAQHIELFQLQQDLQVAVNEAINLIRPAVAQRKKEVRIPVDIEFTPSEIYNGVKSVLTRSGFKFKETNQSDDDRHGPHWLIDLTS